MLFNILTVPFLFLIGLPLYAMNPHGLGTTYRYKLCSKDEKHKGKDYSCWQPYDDINTTEKVFESINILLVDEKENKALNAFVLSNGIIIIKNKPHSFLAHTSPTMRSHEEWTLMVSQAKLEKPQ